MRSFFLLIIMSTVFFAASVFAMNGRTTYQAKIIKPDGYPLEAASVNFRFTVLDTVGSCVLYVEDYTGVNMSGGSGLISFALGNGTRSFPVSGTSQTFAQVFDNSTPMFNCQTPGTYNPGPNDTRKIVMQFNDGNGWQTLPAMAINAVPYAMYANKSNDAKTLNGKADTAFVENATLAALNCNPATQAITFNGASFSCVAISGSGGGITSVTTSGTVLTTAGTASAPVISINVATISSDGYLTSLDYAEFKAKLSASATQITNTLGYAPVSGAAVAAQISSTNLSGDVSGSISANSVVSVGGKSAAQISSSVDAALAATSSATANTLVKRDASGNITINDIYANAAKVNYTDIYRPGTNFNIRLQAPTSLSANYILNLPTTSGTTGQVLSTDGSGNLSWINPSTGAVVSVSAAAPLASTGGANPTISITQASSSSAGYLSSSDWNTFNNKQTATSAAIIATLGYTPAASSTSLGDFKKDGSVAMTGQLQAIAGNVSAPAYTFIADTNTGIYSSGADQISIATSGTDRLWIDGSGVINLGSGFEVDGYTVFSEYPFQLSGAGQATGYTFSNGPAIYSPSVNKLVFTTGGTDLTIDPNGNVGIGTSNPSAKLHLPAGTSSMASFKLASGTLLTSPQSGTMEYDGSYFYLTDGTNTRRAIATGSSAGTLDNASNINSSGNMTMTPTGSVIVSSTTASTSSNTGALIVNGGLGVAGNINASGSIVTTGNMQADSLDVSSTASIGNRLWGKATFGTDYFWLGLRGTGTDGQRIGLGIETNDATTGTVKNLHFRTMDVPRMIVDNSGKVGIGSMNPSAKLHIVDESTAMPRNLVVDNYSSGGHAAQIWGRAARGNSGAPAAVQAGDPLLNLIGGAYDGTSFNETGHIRMIAESNQSPSIHNSFIEFTTASGTSLTEQMRITSNGNVGIGTASPNGKLNIVGDWNGAHGALTLQGDKPTIRFSSSSGTIGGGNHWLIHQGNGDPANPGSLDFYQSTDGSWGAAKLKIAPSGNVGIGTTIPVTKLQIGTPFSGVANGWSASRTMGVLLGDDSDNFYIGLENNGSNEKYATLIWGDDGTEPLLFKTNDANGVATERARMTATGNFGVGTTNPSARLSVFGFAAAEKGLDVMAKYNCPPGDTTGSCGVTDENTGMNTLQRWGFATHPDGWNLALKRNHQGWGNVSYDFVAKDATTETIALSIKYNGNVGIGIASAVAKLHIDNTTVSPNVLPGFKLENSINGTTGSGMTIDTGMGQGLTNLVGGAVIAPDGTGYKYLGARGASRILLGDGTISFYTGNTAVGTANQTVTWSGGGVPESLHISAAGNVGVGITAPNEKLHVVGNLRVQGSTDCTLGNGAGGTNCSSDARLKENIKPIPHALEKINSLKGVEFDWNEKSLSYGRHDIGVIAQDVEKVFPTAVMNDKNTGYKKVDYAVLVAPVIQAVKELYQLVTNHFETNDRQIASLKESKADKAEIEALKARADQLEAENQTLKSRLEAIEKSLNTK